MLSVRPVRLLFAVAAILVVTHVAILLTEAWFGLDRFHGVPRQFDLNGEANLAAWFYSFLLLSCALIALGLAVAARISGTPLARRWGAMAGLLLFMAVDETAQLHDMATGPLRRGLDLDFGVFYFAWLLPATGILTFFAAYFTPLVRSLTPTIRTRLVVAALVYFGGAIGGEMVGGFAVEGGRKSSGYLAVMTVEETLELAGALLLVATLLELLRHVQPSMTVHVVGEGARTTLILDPPVPPGSSRASELPAT